MAPQIIYLRPKNRSSYIESVIAEVSKDAETCETLGEICELLHGLPSPRKERLFLSIVRLGSLRPRGA